MANRAYLSTRGFDAFLEELAAIGANIDEAVADALNVGADVLLEGMQERVKVLTGNLKSKLRKSDVKRDGNFYYIEVGLLRGTDADSARYGNSQEYGTSSMPAHPYIRPTFDEDGTKARRAMKDYLREKFR